jgi:hypothetical protein
MLCILPVLPSAKTSSHLSIIIPTAPLVSSQIYSNNERKDLSHESRYSHLKEYLYPDVGLVAFYFAPGWTAGGGKNGSDAASVCRLRRKPQTCKYRLGEAGRYYV